MWAFYDFREERGVNIIRVWLNSLQPKAAAKINTRLLFMRPRLAWPEQWVSSLTTWPGLLELRIVHSGVQYRPIGFYGPERLEFTLVFGAIEKGSIPKRDLETADANRKCVIATGRDRICEHEFD